MEKELRKYFASVISNNLGYEVTTDSIELDPYVLVFLMPTWISRVTYYIKDRFKKGEKVFIYSDSLEFPELQHLNEEEKNHVLNIYRVELYTIHNIIEYYSDNMIDHNLSFNVLFSNMLMDTCSTPTILTEEYVKINDHGIVYYIPYDILIDNLVRNININPYTEQPYSTIVYNNMSKKYNIEIKMLRNKY